VEHENGLMKIVPVCDEAKAVEEKELLVENKTYCLFKREEG
jgi:hypothetical protein